MKNKKSNIIGIAIIIIFMFITFFLLLKDSELTSILMAIKSIDIKYFILAFVVAILYFVIGAYYRKIILTSLGAGVSMSNCFFYMCSDFYFSAITPSSSGGQPAEVYYMTKEGVPALTSTIVILLISAIYKIVVILLGIIFLFYNPTFITENGLFFEITYFAGLIINIVSCIFFFMLMFSQTLVQKIVCFIINILGRFKIIKNPDDKIIEFHKMLEDYKKSSEYLKEHKHVMVKSLFYAFLQRMSLFAVPYFIYRSFGYSSISIIDFILVQTGVSLSIDSLPLPGGVGASEVLFMQLYSHVYQESILLPAMLLTRGVNYYFCLILTAAIVLINHIRIMKTNSNNS